MELDDLKAGWQELDRRLSAVETQLGDTKGHHGHGHGRGRGRGAGGVRAELRPLVIGQIAQMVVGLLLALWAGGCWAHHLDNLNLLLAGVLVHLYAISMILAGARNLVLVARVDEAQPVVTLQQRMANLRAWRIREGRWFGITGCFIWVAWLVCAAGEAGVDLVAVSPGFVGLNLLVSLVCLAVVFIWSRRSRQPEGSAVRRARERLDEVALFQADDSHP